MTLDGDTRRRLKEAISEARRQAVAAAADGIPHGTEGGYTNHKCRCHRCRAATVAARRERRNRC